jgi:hypothetical protein
MRSEPACHTVNPTSPPTTTTVTMICSASLDVPDVEQRHQRKEERHQQADAEPLEHSRQRQRVVDFNTRSCAGE